jgi:Family of unknown function (DUF6069)
MSTRARCPAKVDLDVVTTPEEVGMAGTVTRRPTVDAARLWAGGLATAFVAALIAILGIIAARGLFGVSVLARKEAGVWGAASTGWYAFGAALAGLAATGLMHLLLVFTPRPMRFFGWIVGLATAAAVLAPLLTDQGRAAQLCTAVLNLVLGIAIGSLVAGSARSATRYAEPDGP